VPRPVSFFQERNNFRGTRLAKASQINNLCANQRSSNEKGLLVGALERIRRNRPHYTSQKPSGQISLPRSSDNPLETTTIPADVPRKASCGIATTTTPSDVPPTSRKNSRAEPLGASETLTCVWNSDTFFCTKREIHERETSRRNGKAS
jgi:hypothetical protein